LIGLFNGVQDRRNRLLDVAKCAATDAMVGKLAEPTLDQVQPQTAPGNEIQMESPMPFHHHFTWMHGAFAHAWRPHQELGDVPLEDQAKAPPDLSDVFRWAHNLPRIARRPD
jgi:hypothetical protein